MAARFRKEAHALAAGPVRTEGNGQADYLGAPAGAANAFNDALAPLGVEVNTLPLSHLAI